MNSGQEERLTFKEVVELEKLLAPPGSRERAFLDAVSGQDGPSGRPVSVRRQRHLMKTTLTCMAIAVSMLIVFVFWPHATTAFDVDRQLVQAKGQEDVITSDELSSQVTDSKVIDNKIVLDGHSDLTMYRPEKAGDFVYVVSHSSVETKVTADRWSLEPQAVRESIGPYTPRGKQGVFVLIICKEELPASMVKKLPNLKINDTRDLEGSLKTTLRRSGQDRITLKFIEYEKVTGR